MRTGLCVCFDGDRHEVFFIHIYIQYFLIVSYISLLEFWIFEKQSGGIDRKYRILMTNISNYSMIFLINKYNTHRQKRDVV